MSNIENQYLGNTFYANRLILQDGENPNEEIHISFKEGNLKFTKVTTTTTTEELNLVNIETN